MKTAKEVLEEVQERRKHLKCIVVDDNIIRDILEMPDDVVIERIDFDYMRRGLVVTCSRPDWDKVANGAEPPFKFGYVTPVHYAEQTVGETGPVRQVHRHYKINWNEE